MSAIPSWARVGAKVVCVDAHGTSKAQCPNLDEGAIYTIAAMDWDKFMPGRLLFWLVERSPPVNPDSGRPFGYKSERFKPLISQADDITTHFEQFLHTPQKIEERA